jgi:hypothetical protein
LLCAFIRKAADDARISPYHISIYTSLVVCWSSRDYEMPLIVFSREIMPLCKISGSSTYHRHLRDLHAFGYLKYEPSFNRFEGSKVYLEHPQQ